MYTDVQTTSASPSYISRRNAANSAQSAYDSTLASSNTRGQSLLGKGFGAGSGVRQRKQGLSLAQGLVGASSAYQNSYLDDVEANRAARLQYETQNAKEANSLAGNSQQLNDAAFSERASEASNQLKIQQAYADRNREMGNSLLRAGSSIGGGILSSLAKSAATGKPLQLLGGLLK